MNDAVICSVCPHHCLLSEGQEGLCRARKNIGGEIVAANYGRLTALALDPIEKKPLYHFMPGSMILSAGSYGCNMKCPFCQNHSIADAGAADCGGYRQVTPEELCQAARHMEPQGNIGIAYTYNEALVGYEFVRDTAKLVREAGMKNVLVTNGMAESGVLEEILPYTDAMNIDLKTFRSETYRKLGGDFDTVRKFILRAAEACHVELTTLIVPGISDAKEDMDEEAKWIASIDPEIVLHVTRYFPQHRMTGRPTDPAVLYELSGIAKQHLKYVYEGNI